eukprot:1958135-Rhodomonas_salina.2
MPRDRLPGQLSHLPRESRRLGPACRDSSYVRGAGAKSNAKRPPPGTQCTRKAFDFAARPPAVPVRGPVDPPPETLNAAPESQCATA